MNFTAEDIMNIVRSTGHDEASYDRANLKKEDFFGEDGDSAYYSVVHVIDSYKDIQINNGKFEMYLIKDENTLMHFSSSFEAMEEVADFTKGYPKDTYFVERREIKEIVRNRNLDLLVDNLK